MTDARTEARWDHQRDLRKHDGPRPHDPPLPFRLQPVVPAALAVALLVKDLKNVSDAAALVEQYAQTVAAEAALQATINAGDRILATIDSFGSAPDA